MIRPEILSAFLAAALTTAAQSDDSNWVGVWQSELDRQPSVILTLAADDGALQGTLVLNGISREGGSPHIAVREAHVLLHPKVSETALSFDVKHLRGSRADMTFTVEQTFATTAKMRCLNCGENAPTVEITKAD